MTKRKFLSFKPIAGTILGLAFVTITGVNVYLVMEGQKNLSDSDVTLKNIEALSEESNNQTQLWIREDEDCIHTFTGAINATITVSLFGIPTKIKLDGNGKFEYKYGNGKTTCTANGQEQCEARYCPSLN